MIVTGLQPTGSIHLGNYLGAIRPTIALQRPAEGSVVFIADYHAITTGHDPVALRDNSLKLAAMLIASGIDDAKTLLFKQSAISAHTELGWILMATAARVGWLNRMTQFKDKMENLTDNSETPSVGLYAYPVLQAADILLYQADEVPVGEDQSQHLNLVVDVAEKFNREFGALFTVPKAVINPNVKRIMSLTDPTKKMSKSEPNDASRVNLDDTPEIILKKIKSAASEPLDIPADTLELVGRPALINLLTIFSAFTGRSTDDLLAEYQGPKTGALKVALADAIIEGLRPVQQEYRLLMANPAQLQVILDRCANTAGILADQTLHAVKKAIGVI